MEKLYLEDPQKITFPSIRDREDRFKRPFTPGCRRDRKKEYRDFDEPEHERPAKPTSSGKAMINFLDI
jgi:hypothetical protein